MNNMLCKENNHLILKRGVALKGVVGINPHCLILKRGVALKGAVGINPHCLVVVFLNYLIL